MAISDYIPNVFGGSPGIYQGLLNPQDQAALEKRANLGGLLGFAGALAQGMSPQGYRRSAAENILTALGAGFGGASQTFQSGIGQMAELQKFAQSRRQLEGLQQLALKNPDLAYLASVSPEEFVRQVSARERAKLYGIGTTPSQVAPVAPPAEAPTSEAAPSVQAAPVFNYDLPFAIPTERVPQPAAPVQTAPSVAPNVPQQAPYFAGVSPENKANAQRLRQQSAFAAQQGDTGYATYLKEEADRLDPKEQVFFRDGKAFSTTRGLIADVSGKRVLSSAEAKDMGLDPMLGKWQIVDNIPSLIPNTGVSPEIQRQQLIAGLPSQLNNVHPTLRKQADALISRAGAMDKAQIISETERILSQDSKILGELNPQLRAAAKDRAIQVVMPNQFSKETKKNLEQEILVTSDAVVRLNDISRSFRPEYQTIQRRLGEGWNTLKDRFGKLNPQDKSSLTEFTQYRQNSLQNLNLTIKAITGAAMSDAEAGRIMASLPNAGTNAWDGDSPTEFKAKLDNTIQQTKYALARKQYALKNGRNWETIPLDSIPDIVRQRGKEIAKQYKLDESKPADLNTIDRQLAAEFGILF